MTPLAPTAIDTTIIDAAIAAARRERNASSRALHAHLAAVVELLEQLRERYRLHSTLEDPPCH